MSSNVASSSYNAGMDPAGQAIYEGFLKSANRSFPSGSPAKDRSVHKVTATAEHSTNTSSGSTSAIGSAGQAIYKGFLNIANRSFPSGSPTKDRSVHKVPDTAKHNANTSSRSSRTLISAATSLPSPSICNSTSTEACTACRRIRTESRVQEQYTTGNFEVVSSDNVSFLCDDSALFKAR